MSRPRAWTCLQRQAINLITDYVRGRTAAALLISHDIEILRKRSTCESVPIASTNSPMRAGCYPFTGTLMRVLDRSGGVRFEPRLMVIVVGPFVVTEVR